MDFAFCFELLASSGVLGSSERLLRLDEVLKFLEMLESEALKSLQGVLGPKDVLLGTSKVLGSSGPRNSSSPWKLCPQSSLEVL